jgi:hypothetical protein
VGDSTEYESRQVLLRFGKDFAVTANIVKRESFCFLPWNGRLVLARGRGLDVW